MAAVPRSIAARARRSRRAAGEAPPTAAGARRRPATAPAHAVGSFRTAAAASSPARTAGAVAFASRISASSRKLLHLPHRDDAERGKGERDGGDGDQEPYPGLAALAVRLLRQEDAFDDGRRAESGGGQAAGPGAAAGVTPFDGRHTVEE